MTDMLPPAVNSGEQGFRQLRQVTARGDNEIAQVNELLADGWRLIGISDRADATVYVLGRRDDKPRGRTGFLNNNE